MPLDLAFALLAGVSVATYSIFSKLASPGIHPIVGATIITGVAFLANLALMLSARAAGAPIPLTRQSLYFVVVVGVAAAAADVFTLSAYASGLKVTSTLMISGSSTAVVLLVGFLFLREPFTWNRLAALALIAGGIVLLQRDP
jgi:drug/metabolite transporter (DMT)-like permease